MTDNIVRPRRAFRQVAPNVTALDVYRPNWVDRLVQFLRELFNSILVAAGNGMLIAGATQVLDYVLPRKPVGWDRHTMGAGTGTGTMFQQPQQQQQPQNAQYGNQYGSYGGYGNYGYNNYSGHNGGPFFER